MLLFHKYLLSLTRLNSAQFKDFPLNASTWCQVLFFCLLSRGFQAKIQQGDINRLHATDWPLTESKGSQMEWLFVLNTNTVVMENQQVEPSRYWWKIGKRLFNPTSSSSSFVLWITLDANQPLLGKKLHLPWNINAIYFLVPISVSVHY